MTPTTTSGTPTSPAKSDARSERWPGRAAQEEERAHYRTRWPHSGGCLDSMGPDPDDEREMRMEIGMRPLGAGWI